MVSYGSIKPFFSFFIEPLIFSIIGRPDVISSWSKIITTAKTCSSGGRVFSLTWIFQFHSQLAVHMHEALSCTMSCKIRCLRTQFNEGLGYQIHFAQREGLLHCKRPKVLQQHIIENLAHIKSNRALGVRKSPIIFPNGTLTLSI